MTLHLQIITPEKIIYDQEITELVVPTTTGQLTILPHHLPILSEIATGELVLKQENNIEYLAVDGGFLEVGQNIATILANYAVHGKDISAVKAEEAKARAEKLMQEKLSAQDFALAEAEFRRAILELKVASKIKRPA